MHVLLTGATGFIGSAIASFLINERHRLKVLVRKKNENFENRISQLICDLDNLENLTAECFFDVDCVVHSAARAHIASDEGDETLSVFRKVNRDATLALAQLAANSGVNVLFSLVP